MQLYRYCEVSQATNLQTFRSKLSGMAADMGFGLFGAMLVIENPLEQKPADYYVTGNAPAEYAEASRDRSRLARDPVLRRLKASSIPFVYDQALYVAEGAGDVWETQAMFGYKTGVCVALHLANHQHFAIGIDRDESLPASETKIARMLADLNLLAVHAHEAATRLLLPLIRPDKPKISARELEVLKWTQAGKTAWEVSVILGISERSVVFHLGNAMRRLGAINKHQAVLRALQLGLIEWSAC